MNKIYNLLKLKNKIKVLKDKEPRIKIGLCHGVFDVLHIGHIKHFNYAKSKCDFLVVSVTSDYYVNKGLGRPYFKDNYRSEFLSNISAIDAVFINNHETPINLIKTIKPDFYFKGIEYKNHKKDHTKNIIIEKKAVEKNKGKIIYTDEIVFSSGSIINKYLNDFNKDQKLFLDEIKKKYTFEKILFFINKLSTISVTLLGEIIVDEYIFSEALGKSGKENHLAFLKLYNKKYLGGAYSVAQNLSNLCKQVNLISYLGENKDYLDQVKKEKNKNVNLNLIFKKNSPTIIKKRYIIHDSSQKIFGSYELNSNDISISERKKASLFLKKSVKKSNLIIFIDYNHGLITQNLRDKFANIKKFKFLNSQLNSSNIGYHNLNYYRNVGNLIINENELRYELRDKKKSIESLIKIFLEKNKINNLIVTRGNTGSILVNKNKNLIINCPAFTKFAKDKVGAGDSMLAMISLCLCANIPHDLSLFLSNIVGAISVSMYANERSISKIEIINFVKNIIK